MARESELIRRRPLRRTSHLLPEAFATVSVSDPLCAPLLPSRGSLLGLSRGTAAVAPSPNAMRQPPTARNADPWRPCGHGRVPRVGVARLSWLVSDNRDLFHRPANVHG